MLSGTRNITPSAAALAQSGRHTGLSMNSSYAIDGTEQ